MIVTLDQMKAHLNITADLGSGDDDLITGKIEAAQNHVERLLGFKIADRFGGTGQEDLPPSLVQAVQLVAAHWYENRESVLVGVNGQSMPIGLWDIVNEYRDWNFG